MNEHGHVWGATRVVRAAAQTRSAKGERAGKHAGRGAKRMPFAVLVAGLIIGGLALLLLLNTASAANEVSRHDISARDASVAARVQELRNEVAASAAPGNLAQAAAALGMVPAENPAFLVVGSDGAVRVLGSPAPVSGPVTVAPHTATRSATHSATHSATKSTTATPTGKASSTATAAHGGTTSTATGASHTSTAAATPTSTPTPTLTIGGNR